MAPQQASAQQQRRLIQQAAAHGAHAIAVWPVDPQVLEDLIDSLVGRGVPIVTVAVDVAHARRTGYVGWDEEQVGRALADLAASQLAASKTLMVLHSAERTEHLRRRWAALKRRLARYPNLTVLARVDSQGQPGRAAQIVRQRMQRYPRLGGWISIEDWPLRAPAGKAPLLPPGCLMVTCHPGPAYWPLLARGSRWGFVATDYFEWGRRAMWLCNAAVRSVPIKLPSYYTPVQTVTSATLQAWKRRWQRWMDLASRARPATSPAEP